MFLTTHYMDEADRVAQRIAIIDHGRIVAQGSSAGAEGSRPKTDSLEGRSRADRIDDSRRAGDAGGPDAPDGEDVEAMSGVVLRALAP